MHAIVHGNGQFCFGTECLLAQSILTLTIGRKRQEANLSGRNIGENKQEADLSGMVKVSGMKRDIRGVRIREDKVSTAYGTTWIKVGIKMDHSGNKRALIKAGLIKDHSGHRSAILKKCGQVAADGLI